ncbi:MULTISPECIES: acyl-CoA dehydrogenase [Pseudomonadaceae]|jgi:alkylation response protein AidB-like acyl-CoA dehydrogenase|uniref:3-methylmercaptopropionyl-CoA dehydrogenase n=3 Tax=Pseudomonas TaxID=286 RepID=B1JB65_PSEPW|nr:MULTISPECIES: acyl-CoA dehydrogenase [Pseudomonadaceae]ERT19088.1 acyl-CoA dehydrogenase [Pseudomonas putida SJ3]AJG12533.1 acyl-CoA dehydrogenase domain-containing protein [Pseudomonas plecoglossicida]EIU1414780.1 acyl-CoA dehydrogenase [Pseudomonas aeruginosa]EKT4450883.1 acyl-CoA dehydrogenase [Pseudomonas putida]KSF98963.1 acyl-CoA dehydrogenase [Pseudomonas aeruginosa]
MSVYTAPLRDMLFTMKVVGNLKAICAQPGNEETTPELVEAILQEAANYAAGILDPLNRSGDIQGARWHDGEVTSAEGFREAWSSFCENGWIGMPASLEWGGHGLPTLVSTAVLEMWKSSNLAFSLCQMLTLGAVEAIAHHGSNALKQRFLEPMVAGRWTGTMNLTEPQAGSDLAALRGRAVPEGDHYRIVGNKIFITWGEHDMAENIVHLVLARLPDAPPGVKGISLFLCPKFLINADGSLGERNDLICTSIEHKLGIHGSPTASMSFGDGGGAIGYLVGEPHQGLACMFTMMNHARLNVGLEGVGVSERAYQHARSYALQRVQGKPTLAGSSTIAGHADVRRMLMDMKARTEAMRAVAYFCAGQMDRAAGHPDAQERTQAQDLVGLLTPVVKGWCTDNAEGITSDGVQIHGGMGYVEETGAAQYFRDARITTIYEGTTGIQANDLIGRKIAREGGRTIKALLTRIDSDARRLMDAHDPELSPIGHALMRAAMALEESVDWLLINSETQSQNCAAGAVPFLRLVGTVIGGWLSARMAEAATTQLSCTPSDTDFLQAKIITATHYATHILVGASTLRDIVVHGAASTLALTDDQL